MTEDDYKQLVKQSGLQLKVFVDCYPIVSQQLKTLLDLVVTKERERCCGIVFGQCSSDNIAQRTVDAIRSGK